MIISASRRTDIPACYVDWMLTRIRERYVCVRNPMNPQQVSKVDLEPSKVDCIVFWTKNPAPMIERLESLADYSYYFQFTLNPYGRDIETNLPDKRTRIAAFKKLSERIGPDKVIWRYDPVLINNKYTVQYHIDEFNTLARELNGYTKKLFLVLWTFTKKSART